MPPSRPTLRSPSSSSLSASCFTELTCSLPADFAVWMGPINPPSYYKDLYEVDEVLFTDDIPSYFEKFAPEVVYVTKGQNSDSGNYAVPGRRWERD